MDYTKLPWIVLVGYLRAEDSMDAQRGNGWPSDLRQRVREQAADAEQELDRRDALVGVQKGAPE